MTTGQRINFTTMLHEILDIIYPRRCAICDSILKRKESKTCDGCKGKATLITEPSCKHCGKSIEAFEEEFCHDCGKKDFYARKGFSLWTYDKYMKKSIAHFKYANRREYTGYYVEEVMRHLGVRLSALKVDALIPIPIHKEKKRLRGFNQAEVLAEGIGRGLKLPVLNHIILREKNTKPQKGLNEKERYQNLKNAFYITKEGKEHCCTLQRVLLVDDIYTTGATIEACASELAKEGVGEIYFICLCIGKDF